jgi:hypothetical protein
MEDMKFNRRTQADLHSLKRPPIFCVTGIRDLRMDGSMMVAFLKPASKITSLS